MADPNWRIRVTVHSHPQYLEALRHVVREAALLCGFAEEDGEMIVLAVVEGWTNVIRHCYENSYDQRMDLEVKIDQGALVVRIDDYGEFVAPETMQGRALEDVKPGGLGLHLMNRVMDRVVHEKNEWGGTSLTLAKTLSAAEKPAPGAGD